MTKHFPGGGPQLDGVDLVDVLLGQARARDRLPFDLPSATQAVIDSPTDVPFSTKDPLFRFGDGIVGSKRSN
jgi:beta-glucosidase